MIKKIFPTGSKFIWLQFIAIVVVVELVIMIIINALRLDRWLSPALITILDPLALGILLTLMLGYWIMRPLQELQQKHVQLRQDWEETFNIITDMITVHDKDFNIIRANKAAQAGLNLPFLNVSRVKCYEKYHGTGSPPIGCPSCQSLKTGIPSASEMFEPHLKKFIEIRAIPRIDSKDGVIGLIHIVRDISDRKRMEKDIQRQKELSESLIQNSAVATFVVDAEHKVLFWNRACEELTGFSASGMIGTDSPWKAFYDYQRPTLADLVISPVPERMSTLYHKHAKSVLNPMGLQAEGWYYNLNGKDRYLIFDAAPITNDKGELVVVIETIQDITGLMRAKENLRLFRHLIDKSYDAVFIIDPKTNYFLDINERACIDTGYTREELLSLGITNIGAAMPRYFPWEGHVQEVREKGFLTIEGSYKRKDGSLFPVEISVSYAAGQKRDYLISIARDISRRKEAEDRLARSEQRLRTIIETEPECVKLIARDGTLMEMNPAGLAMIEADSPEQVVGKSPLPLIAPEYRSPFVTLTKKVFQGHSGKLEFQIIGLKGTRRWLETHAVPLKQGNGAITALLAVTRDITERKGLEGQLRHAQKMEAVGTMTSGIAHDFNNILTAIVGYANIIKLKLSGDDPVRACALQILASTERATALTQGLLTFGKKELLSLKRVDLNEVARRTAQILGGDLGDRITLETAFSDDELIVMADPGQFERVLMNLAMNARDAMPAGGTLTIGSKKAELDDTFISVHGYGKKGAYAVIFVTDTGTGMDEQTKKKIFDPFFTTKETGKGSGLGLSIAYGIIKQHKGFINVCSKTGRGATFTIYLPLAGTLASEQPSAAMRLPEGGGETILIAENDAAVRKLTASVLTQFGYRAIEAEDGDDAVQKFKERHDAVQLVMLDAVMPKRTGREVYDALRKIKPGVKVLFTGGYPFDFIRTGGLAEDRLPFITKPVSPRDLLRKVREVLEP